MRLLELMVAMVQVPVSIDARTTELAQQAFREATWAERMVLEPALNAERLAAFEALAPLIRLRPADAAPRRPLAPVGRWTRVPNSNVSNLPIVLTVRKAKQK